MNHLKRVLVAAILTLSFVNFSYAGTITGSRTSAGTITGSRTGTITGSKAGTITGSRAATLTAFDLRSQIMTRVMILLADAVL